MTEPTLSIIVPACGQVRLTRRCVESIRQWTDVPWELILVSNGSTPAEARLLEAITDQGQQAMRGFGGEMFLGYERVLGYPEAINRGMQYALGEYVCLLNNDAAFTGPWALRLIAALAHGDIVSPIVDQISQPCQRLGDAPGRLSEVGMLFFVCVVMRRELFLQLGGLDTKFGLGNGEDVDFCERAKAAGKRLLVEPAVFVTHKGSATFLAMLGAEGYVKLLDQNRALRDG